MRRYDQYLMHLRTSTVTRRGKTYQYLQLVQSYRRPSDGMPMHRVVATLGNLDEIEIANLRAALLAARRGQHVVVAPAPADSDRRAHKPQATLRYLDAAVLLELLRTSPLGPLLHSLLPADDEQVPAADVVAALVLQRCTDPGSKLAATRWLPRTAVPELLGLAPSQFNNSRLHRVLDALEAATPSLMDRLPQALAPPRGAMASLFLDVTDTWFVGHGPALARRGKTKEGRVERKIGIVLLCDDKGYPLRWEVITGNTADCTAMESMVHSIAPLEWVREVPVVMDRAMGHTAQIQMLLDAEIHFVTALVQTEFDAYTDRIPHAAMQSVDPIDEDRVKEDIDAAAKTAVKSGMQQIGEDLFVLDLGRVERPVGRVSTAAAPADGDGPAMAMRLCRDIEEAVRDGRVSSYNAAGRSLGLSAPLTVKYRGLGKLDAPLQQDILDGKARDRTLSELLRIAREPDPAEQRRRFAALCASTTRRQRRVGARAQAAPPDEPIAVRAVACFNPERFVEQRHLARQRLDRVDEWVRDLNARLGSPRARQTPAQIVAAVDRRLRSDDLLEVFAVEIQTTERAGRPMHQVTLRRDEAEWARRRRFDGFSVLVAHPDIALDAAHLARLYRAKDAVEKDFQTIKSVVELRPLWHRTDDKVRAHVTLCMLALLLERTLEQRLGGTHTAQAALEALAPIHLNRFATDGGPALYTVTQADAAQTRILRTLRLQHLIDDQEVATRIRPR